MHILNIKIEEKVHKGAGIQSCLHYTTRIGSIKHQSKAWSCPVLAVNVRKASLRIIDMSKVHRMIFKPGAKRKEIRKFDIGPLLGQHVCLENSAGARTDENGRPWFGDVCATPYAGIHIEAVISSPLDSLPTCSRVWGQEIANCLPNAEVEKAYAACRLA